MDRLIERSGFPEPFLADDIVDAARWRQNYQDRLVKQDILDFSKIEKISEFQNVLEILKTKVGSEISYENIAGDLSISPKTVKKYVEILEALYIIFLLRPFSHKIARTIRKSPKVYFYDTALVDGDEGTVFENLVGLSLLKQSYGLKDIKGQIASVMYLRDKEKREVDFVLVNEKKEIISLIEVKLSEDAVSKPLNYFTEKLGVKGVQVVKNIRYSFKGTEKIEVREAKSYLSEISNEFILLS